MGKVPTISINKTDGCHVYLSNDSLSCEIVSAKSSEMNILVPNKDGEYVSVLLPRIKRKIKVAKVVFKKTHFKLYNDSSVSVPSPLRRSSLFPSSSRPSGTARSSLPHQQRSLDREAACEMSAPSSTTYPHPLTPPSPPSLFANAYLTGRPPHQLTLTL